MAYSCSPYIGEKACCGCKLRRSWACAQGRLGKFTSTPTVKARNEESVKHLWHNELASETVLGAGAAERVESTTAYESYKELGADGKASHRVSDSFVPASQSWSLESTAADIRALNEYSVLARRHPSLVYSLPAGDAALFYVDEAQLLWGVAYGGDRAKFKPSDGALLPFGPASTGVFQAATWLRTRFGLDTAALLSRVVFIETESPTARRDGHAFGGAARLRLEFKDATGASLTDATSRQAAVVDIQGLRSSLPWIEAKDGVQQAILDAGEDTALISSIEHAAERLLPDDDAYPKAWFSHLAAAAAANQLRRSHHAMAMLSAGDIGAAEQAALPLPPPPPCLPCPASAKSHDFTIVSWLSALFTHSSFHWCSDAGTGLQTELGELAGVA